MTESQVTAISYRARTTFWLAIATLIFLPPFILNNFLQERKLAGVLTAIIYLVVILHVIAIRRGHYYSLLTTVGLVPAVTAYLVTAMYHQEIVGLFWCYPSLLALYFILPHKQALSSSVLMLAVIIPCIWQLLDPALAMRATVTLTTVTIFSAIFVLIIEKQQAELDEKEQHRRESMARAIEAMREPIQRLLSSLPKQERAQEFAGIAPTDADFSGAHAVYDSTLRLQRMVDDLHLIALADLGALETDMQPLQLSQVIQAAIKTQEALLNTRKLHIYQSLDEALWVSGDPVYLRRIFENLLDNCARHVNEGGDVHLRLELDHGLAVVTLTDTGPGVPSAQFSMLFERFFRLENSPEAALGNGLGLALVKVFMQLHHGQCTAFQAVEGGLGIRLSFPCRVAPSEDE